MITRPGPARLPPALAPGGVIFRVYNRSGTMLVDRALHRGMDLNVAKADAIKNLKAEVCLVVYDGDTGERWTPEQWDRLREKMDNE
jgi:hypothetical protein